MKGNNVRKGRLVVLISGKGTNLRAIQQACAQGAIAADIVAVISNHPDAAGLIWATNAGIPTQALDHTQFADRRTFDAALSQQIDAYAPDFVVLAGFMRILTPVFVRHYQGRLLNIHPSLLPNFQGLHTHRRALQAKAEQHGASVHYVTPELDGGPVIMQAVVPVLAEDTEDRLAARVLTAEHKIYPLVIRWATEGRLSLNDQQQILLDNHILAKPLIYQHTH